VLQLPHNSSCGRSYGVLGSCTSLGQQLDGVSYYDGCEVVNHTYATHSQAAAPHVCKSPPAHLLCHGQQQLQYAPAAELGNCKRQQLVPRPGSQWHFNATHAFMRQRQFHGEVAELRHPRQHRGCGETASAWSQDQLQHVHAFPKCVTAAQAAAAVAGPMEKGRTVGVVLWLSEAMQLSVKGASH
jgi:hypothetical protein